MSRSPAGLPVKRYWLTPPDFYRRLDAEFHFDFDPCPNPRPDGFDGLMVPWGKRNWVNAPFKGSPSNWSKKAIMEAAEGKLSVIIWPCYLSREIERLGDAGAETRYAGHPAWRAIEDGTVNPAQGPPCLLFILRGKP